MISGGIYKVKKCIEFICYYLLVSPKEGVSSFAEIAGSEQQAAKKAALPDGLFFTHHVLLVTRHFVSLSLCHRLLTNLMVRTSSSLLLLSLIVAV